MIPFDYRRARTSDEAVTTVADSPRAAFLGGGTNLVDHMKLGVAEPELLVDVTGLAPDTVESLDEGGVRIGAAVRNSDLANEPVIRQRHPALSRALLAGASGQLRNLATTGGNLLQRTRCPYFQDVTTPCNKREPGSGCSALDGYTRYHAVLGASSECVATHPSDMAVAMTALDAVVHTRGPEGERSIPVAELHRLPGDHPEHDTVLGHGELITAVDVPAPPHGARSTYRKVRDRASYAFALVSVAAEVVVDNGTVRSARIAFGGLTHKPWRATTAEQAIEGQQATDADFRSAADAELAVAQPLRDNAYKLPLARNTLATVLRELTSEES
ncbi:xanthine dehydrogenase family protein subunit M [Allosaccharopolyspora coralli]|uniref:Xanthine dehydrogenase family protein subunit M n=1 Tax=Allosaccharopolyspora coralli TaxID=2665642 RepID=A0A5Q3QB19_9PSEU|nr:xanthine dehydrogenase family protein subunit M [Allosaccharopolyspora coralli]QGK71583.1 xanthine dehydrogenase family protein subunit M [Allosaccharopolyspora coralli]